MVDPVRNVIISLKLAGDPQNQTIAREVAGQAQSAVQAAHAVQEASIRQYEKTEKENTKTVEDEAKKRVDKALEEIEKRNKAAKEAADKFKELEEKRSEASQRANEATVAAVQGIADMVEGAAKLGLVSEENFEKFARNFLMVQEGIRVFKGATDVFWKGREALVALSEATHAQTAANNLMAASNQRVATSQAASTATGAAAATAGSGGTAAGGTVLGGMAIAGKAAAVGAGLLAAGAALHDGSVMLLKKMRILGDDSETMSSALMGWYEATQELKESAIRLSKTQQQRNALEHDLERHVKEQNTRRGLERDLMAATRNNWDAAGIINKETPRQQAERQRLHAMENVAYARGNLQEHEAEQKFRKENNRFTSNELTLTLMKEEEDAQRKLYEAEVNRLGVIQSQNEAIADQLQAEKDKLFTLKESAKSEKEALQGKLARMNPVMRERVMEVAEKAKSGGDANLTRQDIAVMEQAGVGQEYVNRYYARQGEQIEGSDTFVEAFRDRKLKEGIMESEEVVDEKQRDLLSGQQQEDQSAGAVRTASLGLEELTQARVKFEAELKLIFSEQVKGLQNNAKQIQQAAADAADAIQQQGMATIDAIGVMQNQMVESYEDIQEKFENFLLKQDDYRS